MKPSKFNLFLVSALTFLLTVLLVVCGDAIAGSYKTLNTAGIAVGTQVQVRSSPKNTPNGAIELEVYEWETGSVIDTWQCRILDNKTGQALSITMVGLAGGIFSSCTAPVGLTCDTAAQLLVPDAKFLCIVSTGNELPVIAGANYKMAVLKVVPAAASSLGTVPSPSGAVGQ